MTIKTHPKRAWIAAKDSFDNQATALLQMADRLDEQLERNAPPRPKKVAIVGIGASHAAAAAPAYQMRADGIDAARFLPSELPDGLRAFDGLAIYVSQSGRSAEVVAIAAENNHAAARLALTNYHPSPLADVCKDGLNLGNLPDSSVSFVSFTGTLLALGLLGDFWAGRRAIEKWKALISRSKSAAEEADGLLKLIAQTLVECPNVDFVAPAPILSVAEEAALMFREGPRIMATGMETRQYLHGPMDAAKVAAHVVIGGEREALLVKQLAEQTDKLIFITGQKTDISDIPAKHLIVLPAELSSGVEFSIAATFVTQALTLHAAALRSIDINEAVFTRLDTKTDKAAVGR